MMNKSEQLLQLARKRQQTRWVGYGNIGDYHNGVYECDFVSPYSKSAHNVDTEILIFLQDWASHDFLSGAIDYDSINFGYTRSRPTNKNLIWLVHKHFGLALNEVYVTNLFPFVKLGSMSKSIKRKDLIKAAREFALPQMEIIEPKVALCLGEVTLNALREACLQPTPRNFEEGIRSPFMWKKTKVFGLAHPSTRGQNNRGGVARVSQDWNAVMQDLQKL